MSYEDPARRVDRLRRVTNRPKQDLSARIPPGQFVTEKFPVLHYGDVPQRQADFLPLLLVGEALLELAWRWRVVRCVVW